MPSQMKGDVFVRGSAQLQAQSCCNVVRMCHNAGDREPAVVLWVRVSEITSHAHRVSHLAATQHGIGRRGGLAELVKRFTERNTKKLR
jgi:hypothetical protein